MNKITAGGEAVFVSDKARELVKEFRMIQQANRLRKKIRHNAGNLNEAARLHAISEAFSTAELMFLKYYGRK